MARLLVSVVVNAIALWVAASVVNAVFPSNLVGLLIVAVVFGALNSIVRPILNVITCPAYILTLGLFTFIMNVIILWLTERLTGLVQWGGFWPMFWAGIIISLVSFVLNLFMFGDENRK